MTDTSTTPGIKGFTRSTWRDESHLRGMLLALIPKCSDREELETMYLGKVKESPALIEEAARRCLDNDLERIQQPATRSRRSAISAQAVIDAIQRLREVVFLDIIITMADGTEKKLRDCTGRECKQIGGRLIKIAARVKPDQLVGDALQEAEVRKLYGTP